MFKQSSGLMIIVVALVLMALAFMTACSAGDYYNIYLVP